MFVYTKQPVVQPEVVTCKRDLNGQLADAAANKQQLYQQLLLWIFTGSIARSANQPVFSLLRGRF